MCQPSQPEELRSRSCSRIERQPRLRLELLSSSLTSGAAALKGRCSDLLVAYTYSLINPGHENLPISYGTGGSRPDDGIYDVVHYVIGKHDVDLYVRHETQRVFIAAIGFR